MASKIETLVMKIAEPIVSSLGYEVVDVEYNRRKDSGNELVVYIDKPDGVSLDDYEVVSRALDEPLDIADPIEESYVLCVSSPGIDRPLKNDRDFKKSLNKEVEIKLYKKINGSKDYVGILKEFDDDSISISFNKDVLKIDRKEIALIRLYVSF